MRSEISLLALDVKNSRILGLSADGTVQETIVDNCGGAPDGIAVDGPNGHIYWTNMGKHHEGERFGENDGFIERADLDGSNRIIIIKPGDTFTPKQLKLDLENRLIYWCDREGMRVMRSGMDGSNITTLVETGKGDEDRKDQTRHCVGIALDFTNEHIYWSQKGPAKGGQGRIFRAGIAYTPGMKPDQRKDLELIWENLPEPIDLELNELLGDLYWTDRGAAPKGNTLNRANPMLTQLSPFPEILSANLREAIGLSLNIKNNQVFFADLAGHIYCSRLDGSERKMIYTGDAMFTGIACLH